MKRFLKVTLIVIVMGCVLIGGCTVLLAGGANEVDKSLKRQQNTHSITNEQGRSVKLGTTEKVVRARFGQPDDTQESVNEGLGNSSCIYYKIRGGSYGDTWQFCFGDSGKLENKNRL